MLRSFQYVALAAASTPTLPANGKGADGEPFGLPLGGTRGFRVSLLQADAQAIDIGSIFEASVWHPTLEKWIRVEPLDITTTVSLAAPSCYDKTHQCGEGFRVAYIRTDNTTGTFNIRLDADPNLL